MLWLPQPMKTELDPWDMADVISTDDDHSTADRLTLSQLEDKTPPQVPLNPPLTEFKDNVMKAIRKGVYDWSLTLDYVPDDIIADEYNPIVRKAFEAQTDHKSHLGNISFMELGAFAKELMLNRIKNKDIPQIVRQNQYNKRHKAAKKELMGN